jgi:DNA-binding Lrp family transcriptional regulator
MIEMSLEDKKLLNIIQNAIPMVSRPYAEIGRQLGADERSVIAQIRDLKRRHIVRQISAIFDTRKLGYKSVLVAMRFPEQHLSRGARIINRHPGVSHNYGRNHYFNLWFTLAVPPNESIEETVKRMEKESGAECFRILPTLRFFKIGVNFDMITEKGSSNAPLRDDYSAPSGMDGNPNPGLTPLEIDAVRELQEDLPLISEPFKPMVERLGMTERKLFEMVDGFQQRQYMRRFSAVLHHRRAGFRSNAMACWKVTPGQEEAIGKLMAKHPSVSHCYERPVYPDWPYSHFTMLHATAKAECEDIAKEISKMTGITDYAMLYSTREYKKTRVRYFV